MIKGWNGWGCSRRRLAGPAALALALVTTGCGGPDVPFDVTTKEIASDIVMGDGDKKVPPVPLPPTGLDVSLAPREGAIAPPRFIPDRTPDPTPVSNPTTTAQPLPACATASPFAAPALAAELHVDDMPAAATYAYRNEGTATVSGVNASEERYSAPSSRQVLAVERTPEGFRFDVLATLGDTVTRTSYRVNRIGALPGEQGLFITAVHTTEPDGSVHLFEPTPPVTLVAFPAESGATWRGTAVDAGNGVILRYEGSVGPLQRVDACGQLIDAVSVTLKGELFESGRESPGVQFTATYAVATQYGGLSVKDDVDIIRTHSTGAVNRRNVATINSVPDLGVKR